MHRKARNLALLNVAGGIAVLSSYVHGIANAPHYFARLTGPF